MTIPNTFQKNLATSASAGTGKTFNLAVRYLSIVMLGGKLEEIYALTFTNKAANEMEDRIQSIIMNPSKHKEEIAAISKITKNKESTIIQKIYKLRKDFLLKETHITTIDAFTSTIVRSFGSRLGVSSNFEVGNLSSEVEVGSFISYLKENNKIDSLVSLSDSVDDKVAGIIDGFHMLNSVEKEIQEAIVRQVVESSKLNLYEEIQKAEQNIYSIVAQIKNLMKDTGEATDKVLATFDFDKIQDLVGKKYMERNTLEYSTYKKVFTTGLDAKFMELKKEITKWYKNRENLFLVKLIDLYGDFKVAMDKTKSKLGILTFSDITNKAVDAMKFKDLEYLRFKLDSKIQHLLIDEFQDTSWAQAQIMKPIIESITLNDDAEFRSFFFVGDVKQSIYRFRGGNVRLFDKSIKEFGMEENTLDINYRSTEQVIDFTNKVFQPEYSVYPTQRFNRNEKGLVSVFSTGNPFEEIGERIKAKLEDGVAAKDIAVLVFTNKEVLDAEVEIRRVNENVKIVTDTSSKILENKNVSALIELLRYQQTGEEFYLLSFYGMMGVEIAKGYDVSELQNAFLVAKDYLDHPAKWLKTVISEIGSFNGDLNVIKFIEIAMRFESLEDLYMNLETITDSVLNPEDVDGVRVLTIHKAKGLEFENVIVLDKKAVGGKNHSQLFYEFDENADVKMVWHRFSKREVFDIEYERALDLEKQKEHNDELNVLYVAFTRAGKNLDILRYPDKSKMSILKELPLEY